MPKNKFYLSFGRHGHYGTDTAIERSDMLKTYLLGKSLKIFMPECETVYFSPLARAKMTAEFTALGIGCGHLIETEYLTEDVTTFAVRQFLNKLLLNTDENVAYYHFVTHLPVVEKLGLPFLSAGEVCLLTADNKEEMLAENFELQIIRLPEPNVDFYRSLREVIPDLEHAPATQIYNALQQNRF